MTLFNLIVYGQELPSGAFGLPLDRMPRSVGEVIRPDKGEWTSAKDHAYRYELAKYPVLLTPELYGHEEVAYVGSVEDIGHPAPEADYQCTIRRDERIPAVQGSLLEPFAEAWGMPKYGKYFRHTEWRLVDADLYKLLVTELHPSSIAPKMFNLPQRSPKNQVALMMPFAAEFNPVREAVDKAAKLAGVKCIRVDDIWKSSIIVQDVVDLIGESRIVLADMTNKNPNVFYEVGIAHTLGREVVPITQSDQDVPSDLAGHRYLKYVPNGEGYTKLAKELSDRLTTLLCEP